MLGLTLLPGALRHLTSDIYFGGVDGGLGDWQFPRHESAHHPLLLLYVQPIRRKNSILRMSIESITRNYTKEGLIKDSEDFYSL